MLEIFSIQAMQPELKYFDLGRWQKKPYLEPKSFPIIYTL